MVTLGEGARLKAPVFKCNLPPKSWCKAASSCCFWATQTTSTCRKAPSTSLTSTRLLTRRKDKGWGVGVFKSITPLQEAVKKGDEVVNALLASGAKPDAGVTLGPLGLLLAGTPLYARRKLWSTTKKLWSRRCLPRAQSPTQESQSVRWDCSVLERLFMQRHLAAAELW